MERSAAVPRNEDGELTVRPVDALATPVATAEGGPRLDEFAYLQLVELAELLRNRALSPVEITKATLARIARLDPGLHSYLNVTADFALAQARKAEGEIQSGLYRGPLHGVP